MADDQRNNNTQNPDIIPVNGTLPMDSVQLNLPHIGVSYIQTLQLPSLVIDILLIGTLTSTHLATN
jgi:hypothetical protein